MFHFFWQHFDQSIFSWSTLDKKDKLWFKQCSKYIGRYECKVVLINSRMQTICSPVNIVTVCESSASILMCIQELSESVRRTRQTELVERLTNGASTSCSHIHEDNQVGIVQGRFYCRGCHMSDSPLGCDKNFFQFYSGHY